MAKIIAVYGKAGSGCTTFSCSLAVSLGNFHSTVCVLSGEADCGELQTFFGESVSPEKGFDKAKNSSIGLFQDKVIHTRYPGVDILPVSDDGAEKIGEQITSEMLDTLLETMNLAYSYIIIDCCASSFNDLVTYLGLYKDTGMFFCLYKPARTSVLWHRAHQQLFEIYDKKPVHIVSNLSFSVRPDDFRAMLPEVTFQFQLPYVSECDQYENMGTPIVTVKTKDKAVKTYRETMRAIAEFCMEKAGKPQYSRTIGRTDS